MKDLQATNFFERFPKDEENERELFMQEMKAQQDQWNDPKVYLKNKPRKKRRTSLEMWKKLNKNMESE